MGDTVQMQNLSDQNGVIVSKNGFNSYSVRIDGSGLVKTCNRTTLRNILPVVQSDKISICPGLELRAET